MERNKKIQLGLLALVGGLLIANLLGGGIANWFGKSEGDMLRGRRDRSEVAHHFCSSIRFRWRTNPF